MLKKFCFIFRELCKYDMSPSVGEVLFQVAQILCKAQSDRTLPDLADPLIYLLQQSYMSLQIRLSLFAPRVSITTSLWYFTARVRSTTGRYCFHRCLSVHRGGEGGSGSPPGGVPDRVPPGGVPDRVHPPPPGGYLTGYPPPPPPRGGTQLGQHSEYLLHSGRYASWRSRRRTFLLEYVLIIFASGEEKWNTCDFYRPHT